MAREKTPEAPRRRSLGTFEDAYRRHFEKAFGPDRDFTAYTHAYQFGREQAVGWEAVGRTYEAAEEDLRALYALRYPAPPFAEVKEAVRFGFYLGGTVKGQAREDESLPHGEEDPEDVLAAFDRTLLQGVDDARSEEEVMRMAEAMSTKRLQPLDNVRTDLSAGRPEKEEDDAETRGA